MREIKMCEDLCQNCRNSLSYTYNKEVYRHVCILGADNNWDSILECSHFKPKEHNPSKEDNWTVK
jgi:hypothetical protein